MYNMMITGQLKVLMSTCPITITSDTFNVRKNYTNNKLKKPTRMKLE